MNQKIESGGEMMEKRVVAEKSCCTICDAKKRCSVCETQTLLCCSDCRVDLKSSIYVCGSLTCGKSHDKKCPGTRESSMRRYTIDALERVRPKIETDYPSGFEYSGGIQQDRKGMNKKIDAEIAKLSREDNNATKTNKY